MQILTKLSHWGISIDKIRKVIKFLQAFGYLPEDLRKLNIGVIVDAVIKFQQIYGLKPDGVAGPKTFMAMEEPRCGHKDTNMLNMGRVAITSWGIRNLTYNIIKRDNDLPAETWDKTISYAFKLWSDVCNLNFTETDSGKANFLISVGSGSQDNFDGPGRTLAWAYLPPRQSYNGQLIMKFDTSETWVTLQATRGTRLLNVACHEIGHLLGLEHSKRSGALMAPYYSRSITKPQQNDDISRIQAIYGPSQNDSGGTGGGGTTPSPKNLQINIQGDIAGLSIPGYRITKA